VARCRDRRAPLAWSFTTTSTRLTPPRIRREELANALTHGLGIPLGVAALIYMVMSAAIRGEVIHVVGCAIFGTTIVAMYVASTLYHGTKDAQRKRLFRRIDYACIYLLIAGTYTPFLLAKIGGVEGALLLSVVWAMAISGIILKALLNRMSGLITTLSYLGLGWIAVFIAAPVMDGPGLVWLAAGGAAYTLGVIFFSLDGRVPYFHTVWHICVLAGTTFHVVAVLTSVIPPGALPTT